MAGKRKSLVKPRGGIYYENFTVKGRRFRGSLGTDDRETAETIAAKTHSDALLGNLTNKKPEMTLDVASGRYWTEHAQFTSSPSDAMYRLPILLEGLGKDTLLSEVTPARITTYITGRRIRRVLDRKTGHERIVSRANATINRELILLRAILYRAKDLWGVQTPEIKWGKLFLEQADERQHILSTNEEDDFFSLCRLDFNPMLQFSLKTGVRLGNVIGLTWNQVKWEAGHIILNVKSRKPGGKTHYIPITKAVAAILEGERGNHERYVFTFISQRNRSDKQGRLIQVKGQRYPFSRTTWRADFRRARKAAGIEAFRFHDLRHTAGSRTYKVNRNLKTVKEMLGHQNIKTTLRYLKTDVEDVREAMEQADLAHARHKA